MQACNQAHQSADLILANLPATSTVYSADRDLQQMVSFFKAQAG